MEETFFFIAVDRQMIQIDVEPSAPVSSLYEAIRDYSSGSPLHAKLKQCRHSDCKYYKLKTPIEVKGGKERMVRACMDNSNWEILPLSTPIKSIAKSFHHFYVYIVIEFPEGAGRKALNALKKNHQELFTRLQITVQWSRGWFREDVEFNGGVYSDLPSEIEERLSMVRVYKRGTKSKDIDNARLHSTEFARMFSDSDDDTSVTVKNHREFFALYALNRCFVVDAEHVKKNTSSSLKATTFLSYFVRPPYFSSAHHDGNIEYREKMPWEFSIFVTPRHPKNAWRPFQPNSDWSVISTGFLCPFVISEVTSQKNQDRSPLLLQAIAAARVGSYLLRAGSHKKFFVVVIYLTDTLIAERYIVSQLNPSEPKGKVLIHQKDFDLSVKETAIDFLREMFNVVTMIEELVDELDGSKRGELLKIHQAASKIKSLDSQGAWTSSRRSWTSSPRSTIATISDGSEQPEDDDPGVLDMPEVRSVLERMNYKVSFVTLRHPHIGAVVRTDGQDGGGYVKFVKEGYKEVEILNHLNQFDSPQNHAIRPIHVWSVPGGTIILMPFGGGWLSSLQDPDHYLWAVARQIFEAVGFLHEHNVAHMDLKPSNIVIPREYGRLSLIDFHLSVRVKSAGQKFAGYVGTEGYIAPEVGKKNFNAIKADLWSCGKVLEELCELCEPSVIRDRLLEITTPLLDENPDERPTMSQVLGQMLESTPESLSQSLGDSRGFFIPDAVAVQG